jgi:hypothetical protein
MKQLFFLIIFVLFPAGCAMDFDELRGYEGRGNEPVNSWAASGKITTEDPTSVFAFQANFPEAGNFTVQFGVFQPKRKTNSISPVITEAIVNWSTAGNSVTRRITISQGTCITGMGNAVNIRIIDNTPTDTNFPKENLPYDVSVQISKGVRAIPAGVPSPILIGFNPNPASRLLLPRTGVRVNVGGTLVTSAVPVTYPVPQDAGIVSVLVNVTPDVLPFTIPPAGATVTFVNDAAGISLAIYDPLKPMWIPLFPGTTGLQLTTNIAPQNINFSIYFGIDG